MGGPVRPQCTGLSIEWAPGGVPDRGVQYTPRDVPPDPGCYHWITIDTLPARIPLWIFFPCPMENPHGRTVGGLRAGRGAPVGGWPRGSSVQGDGTMMPVDSIG